jgi:nicotinate-nucleotide adenylyltransferase
LNTRPIKKVGLYFGSFNPIHIGHLAIANYLLEYSELDEIWLVVSPQNPAKSTSKMLGEYQRLEMVNMAIEPYPRLRASAVEFSLPKPSYTYRSIAQLYSSYPAHKFTLIMGADNLEHFHKWKNYNNLLETCNIMVYPRNGHNGGKLAGHSKVQIIDAPQMEISSSMLRLSIKDRKCLRSFFPPGIYEFILKMGYYERD